MNVPAVQPSAHSLAPGSGAYRPALQFAHAPALLPPAAAANMPAAHSTQPSEAAPSDDDHRPGLHAVHSAAAAAALKRPAVQLVQTDGSVAPVALEYMPEVHAVQFTVPICGVDDQRPAGQSRQAAPARKKEEHELQPNGARKLQQRQSPYRSGSNGLRPCRLCRRRRTPRSWRPSRWNPEFQVDRLRTRQLPRQSPIAPLGIRGSHQSQRQRTSQVGR